jgi:transketolase
MSKQRTTIAAPAVSLSEVELITDRARFVREETVRLISIAKTGHYASTFSCAEILAALYYGVLHLRRGEPDWPGRDRFLLGKGHAAVGLYPILADWGFLDPAVLDEYTRLGNPLGDHPDMRRVPGVDFSSGSLGHNLSVGLGIALAARFQGRDFRVFVLLGDGELDEGQVWEAALSAAHHRAGNLITIIDRNRYSLDGAIDEVIGLEPLADKWRSFGWETRIVDGHNPAALLTSLRELRERDDRAQPAALIAETIKGKGVSFMESEVGWHLGYLSEQDEARVIRELRTTE